MRIASLWLLKPLFMDLVQGAPKQISLLLVLMLCSSATSGIGILFIIPLLSAVGVELGATAIGASFNVKARLNEFASYFGIELDFSNVLVIYLFLIISIALLGFFTSILSAKLQRSFVTRLRNRVFGHVLYANWQYLHSERMADFMRLSTGQVSSVGVTTYQLLGLLNQIVLVLVYIGISLLLSPVLTGLALGCAFILVLFLIPLNHRIHNSGQVGLQANREIFGSIMEQLSSLKIIKSYTAEGKYLEHMKEINFTMETEQVRMAFYSGLTRFVNLSGAAIIFTVLFYVAYQIIVLPLTNLLLILFIFSRLMPQVSGLQSTMQRLINAAPTYEELINKSEELVKNKEPAPEASKAPKFKKQISIENLSFRYPNSEQDVFSRLNLKLKKYATIALTGPSGSGKSTLADIIAGLLPPTSGEMYVDQTKLNAENRHHWRSQLSYVTQDIFLFNSSVRDNLTWVAESEVSDENVWDALRKAAANTFVSTLPDQLDTIIGDRGVRLSGGERQRMALARALISGADILILDEATSALDRDNELIIRDSLINLKGQHTVIIIAHDEFTTEHVDMKLHLPNFAP